MLGKRSVHYSDVKIRTGCRSDTISSLSERLDDDLETLSSETMSQFFQELGIRGISNSPSDFNMIDYSSSVLMAYMHYLIDIAVYVRSDILGGLGVEDLKVSVGRLLVNIGQIIDWGFGGINRWPVSQIIEALETIEAFGVKKKDVGGAAKGMDTWKGKIHVLKLVVFLVK